ncbi:MAG: hypothetical protein NWT08_05080 [Akkermansiaceae bacterium]|jgi:beta-agarase|nr:hypothetical protein [Akkermansiaceae bacterium]MDP4721363.1 hypothetical protein [Akkermansiaceae bacterium]MDP4779416.1 hypothetical protein [Akkermansiaceae bacterium]MDP4846756.1 hypothetical protein [Akkermansiaceae bacterium]MDP4897093.1 hypothetical protein [Akkermansiaceae bacterium]
MAFTKSVFTASLIVICADAADGQEWKGLPVPADPGAGKTWKIQAPSDDFNYDAPAAEKGARFDAKWIDTFHNQWTGPGKTIWDRKHSLVADGQLQIIASRANANQVFTGCITSKQRVVYPVFIEARVKISNSTLASDVWLLSPDDTQEIDILEAYGTSYSAGAKKDQTWFAERLHLSHHMFIRSPFQDYQPTDAGSWYTDGTLWRDNFLRIGVYWKDPLHLEYYLNGKLVRTVSGAKKIDPHDIAKGKGLHKEMDIIINAEDQDWRSMQGITPTDEELANKENHTFRVDWIRVYKPVKTQNPPD